MTTIGQPYTSGSWLVREGEESAFIERWTEFTGWAHANARGAQGFLLLRDITDGRRFTSFAGWDDKGSVDAWRSTPEFAERLAACRELCEEFTPTDQVLAAAVGA